MKIFLDTADVGEIHRASDAGLIDGITTNPSLISKIAGNRDPKEIYLEICEIVDGPVSLEVVAIERARMVEEGRKLAGIHENAVVKVPLTEDGLKACRDLVSTGIRVNVTLCFSASQALFAAKAGASYISPFVGRIDDISGEGMQLIHQIRQIYDGYGYATEILAASIRHPLHVVESMTLGADCCTIPPKVLWQLVEHPLTDRGLEAFLADWDKSGAEL
ncbi:MAG TPA: fructose-6-phosphate aldolase [Gemmatimonadetes bacterium]|jgi:transaldolase|nr:fructose-6-phosphate aldolase [Gemmatimonadota bacterium]HIC14120.1 fructose-6-phosphate aldolase [Gemmatimonadota bacterium]